MAIIKPPTQEEIRDISSLLSSGEPYSILGCTPDSSHKDITKRYRDLARKHHPDKQKHNGNIEDDSGDMMTRINNAYKILSNERFREVYDTYLLADMLNGGFDEGDINGHAAFDRETKLRNIILTGLSLGLSAISIPFRTIAFIVHSTPTIIKPRHVCKSLIKQHGFFGGLYRGTVFLISSSVVEFVREELVDKVFSKFNLIDSRYKSLANRITRIIVNFPIRLIGDIIDLAPVGYGVVYVVKNVILRYDQSLGNIITAGSGKEPPLQWKNLFYSFGYSITLVYIRKLVKRLVGWFDNFTYDGYCNNPNSLFFRYSNYLMSKTLFRAALLAILTNPLDVLHSQYPRILLESWKNGHSPLSVLSAPNPIHLAVDIYRNNNNSILKFYNGVIPLFFSKILDDVSNQLDEDDDISNNQYDDEFM